MNATLGAVGLQALGGLVPMAHVADVARSVAFYQKLGFEVGNTLEQDGRLQWAWLKSGKADFMLTRSPRPINPQAQDVLFYLYAPDVAAYREQLAARGVEVGEMRYPFYSPRGEFRVQDPDGYALMITHAD
ncbi:MAG: VOC family protein [Terriglobales bacterium]